MSEYVGLDVSLEGTSVAFSMILVELCLSEPS